MSKSRKKNRPPKRVLALPDLEQSKAAVLSSTVPIPNWVKAAMDDWKEASENRPLRTSGHKQP
jgi:hypothetical protein